ncbi:MAG: acyltransferase [Dokdonella sp.]|uniref:LpxL/LpxP family acyltransferase n=1 Tax=Dokdonella sp. TaxID=2291710 RepID=UPI0025B9A6DD|nr:acyltransferase [Dokdonella sp.]MBZ0221921.1 acyltransferase [Dokdonella sp.]MCC7255106.1 acyltransferase [Dokdonella sp.]
MSEHWRERKEGGGRFAISLILAIGLRCGRGVARLCLYPITLYFYFRRPYERRVSYAFFARIEGRRPSLWRVLQHIHRFAGTLLDRAFLLAERYARFEVQMHGLDALIERMRPDRGVLLLGAHVGSFEVLRVATIGHPEVKLRVVLDTQKTPALTELLHSLNPQIGLGVIDASRPGSEIVLAMSEALAEGTLVTLLADRVRGDEQTVAVEFFGAPALLPVAPFALGGILDVPVVLCLGMYRGGNRYDLHFEPLADGLPRARKERDGAVRALAQAYASRLEHHVRLDPCNWFNWHDFWNPQGRGVDRHQPAAERSDAVARDAA